MDYIRRFVNRHQWLVTIFSILFIGLPQYIESLWSLAEKILGRAIAMPNITWAFWITIPIGLIMLGIAIWAIKSKESIAAKTETAPRSDNPTDTLIAMHRRLVYLQKEKASHTKVSVKQLEKVLPTLADRTGTVKLKDWPKFKEKVRQRVQRAMPRRFSWRPLKFMEYSKLQEEAQFAALFVAKQIKDELFQAKEWEFEDGLEVSKWLDGYKWGVKEVRDNDPQWQALWESISSYLQDEELRELIKKHIDFSYIYNNVSLIIYYSEQYPKDVFSTMLHETLVGSPISPSEAEIALGEILEQISNRLKILEERYPLYQSITVKPITGKREADYERTEHAMWAELQVTNTSTQELSGVQVNITKCLTLQEKQDSANQNDFVMWDFLKLKPFCVYWSERQAQPKQMNMDIPRDATRSALVAFQDNSNGGQFNFNSLNHEWVVGGVKIDVEISSHEAVLYSGEFYIECHPNYLGGERAKFEFVEWDTWSKDKKTPHIPSKC